METTGGTSQESLSQCMKLLSMYGVGEANPKAAPPPRGSWRGERGREGRGGRGGGRERELER